ncbi:MAG: PLDc N-terminal domain-containing protein [Janthinobacterium lividum]
MKRSKFLTSSLLLSMGLAMVGMSLFIGHRQPYDQVCMGAAILALLAFTGTAIYEVLTSRLATGGQKVLWAALLLSLPTTGGLFYLLLGRKSIVPVIEQ